MQAASQRPQYFLFPTGIGSFCPFENSSRTLCFAEDLNSGGTFGQSYAVRYLCVCSNSRTVVSFDEWGVIVCYWSQQWGILHQCHPCQRATTRRRGGHLSRTADAGPFGLGSISGEYMAARCRQYISSTNSSIDSAFSDGMGNLSFITSEVGRAAHCRISPGTEPIRRRPAQSRYQRRQRIAVRICCRPEDSF